MVEPSRTDESPLDAFLEAVWRDTEAGEIRPLEEYLRAYPGDALGMAREYIRIVEERAGRTAGGFHDATDAARIGSYRIVSELGRGGQAVVYLAEDLKLRRRVALKVINVGPLAGENAIDRFRREAEVSARLDHPGICPVFEIGSEGGLAWIAMRYVEGETLARRITTAREKSGAGGPTVVMLDEIPTTGAAADWEVEDGRGPAATPPAKPEILRVVALVKQAARALHAAHEAGVLHRDIKPGNIMVSGSGAPVILDFGLARDLTDDAVSLTRTGDLMGTPHYMSPEQLTRRTIRLDRRTDIYSLGVTLYECLTLRSPHRETRPVSRSRDLRSRFALRKSRCGAPRFDEPSRDALYHAILTKPPPPPRKANPAIPRDLEVVIETALAKDRDLRYQTALALAEDLGRVLRGEPVLARRPGVVLRSLRWARRRWALVALILLAVSLGYVAGLTAFAPPPEVELETATPPDPAQSDQTDAAEPAGTSRPVSLTSTGNPFFDEAAQALADRIQTDVHQRLGNSTKLAGFVGRRWVFLVEEDPGWSPEAAVRSPLERLIALEDIILHDLGDILELKPVSVPRPALLFKSWNRFTTYLGDGNPVTSLARFDARTGRFAFHDDCDYSALLHEGTHVLMTFWSSGFTPDKERSPWFEEGIAEWYAGTRRIPAAGGGWTYLPGAFHSGRLDTMRAASDPDQNELFRLEDLIAIQDLRLLTEASPRRAAAFYAQAWFLVYFLNRFNVDHEGLVHPDQPGSYREGWRTYVREEFRGRTGRAALLKSLGMEESGMELLETLCWRFFRYVSRKLDLNQVKDGQLIPWDQFVNKRGQIMGERNDDLLPPFDPKVAPPRKK